VIALNLLADVERRLDGPVRWTKGEQRIASNVCPCCGGHRRQYRRCFYVERMDDGHIVGCCFKCEATQQAFSAALGIHFGPHRIEVIDNGDLSPYSPEADVLAQVRRGEIEVVVDYGSDEIGQLANKLVWHVVPARRKAKRLVHPPTLLPMCNPFARKLARAKLGLRVSNAKIALACKRIRERSPTRRHQIPAWQAQKRGYRYLTVCEVTTTVRSSRPSPTVNPARSCSWRGSSRARPRVRHGSNQPTSTRSPPELLAVLLG
jgi:hypothetical protein